MLLAKEQRKGVAILLGIALFVWIGIAIGKGKRTQEPEPLPKVQESPNSSGKRDRWEAYKDSLRQVQTKRYAAWDAENRQRYDSFRLHRQQFWDSVRVADSLWRDSVGWKPILKIKKDTVLDLNHCDTTQLQYIRGIGSYTARLIVRYREQLGGYYSVAQLGDSVFATWHLDTLTQYFTANPADVRLLPVNAANVAMLQRHPYLRYEQAKAIYTLRRQRIRLESMDDLRCLREFSDQDLNRLRPYLTFE